MISENNKKKPTLTDSLLERFIRYRKANTDIEQLAHEFNMTIKVAWNICVENDVAEYKFEIPEFTFTNAQILKMVRKSKAIGSSYKKNKFRKRIENAEAQKILYLRREYMYNIEKLNKICGWGIGFLVRFLERYHLTQLPRQKVCFDEYKTDELFFGYIINPKKFGMWDTETSGIDIHTVDEFTKKSALFR